MASVKDSASDDEDIEESERAVSEFFTPLELLYHYTTAGGLQGIITSASVWATDVLFLNDARELKHGFDSMKKAISELRSEKDAATIEMVSFDFFQHGTAFRAYVSCFCEDGDLLSQWRGYSGAGGYAIGFDGEALREILESRPVRSGWLSSVVYDHEHTKRMAKVWADHLITAWDELSQKLLEPGLSEDDAGRLLYEFHGNHMTVSARACLVLKNSAFSEEKEWRIISLMQPGVRDGSGPGVMFRQQR